MRWQARGTMALLVSALVGVTAGVIVGFTTGTPGPSTAQKDGPSASPSVSSSPDDPLGLGVPLENLDCTGDTILVVGWGETRGALINAVTANQDADVKYLVTAESCNTLYGAERQARPRYAVYLGPFDSISEPCSLRMSIDHSRDVVTTLKRGVKIHVQCLCVLKLEEYPTLNVGMVADTREGIYIRALQRLLIDIGQNPSHYVTGEYNERTAKMIEPLQRINAIDPRLYGVVEEQTWRMLRDRGCLNYDF